jgi:hypothetical protein
MHGFFIDHRLYAKAKAVADPFAYEEYRQQRIREKLDAARAARITVTPALFCAKFFLCMYSILCNKISRALFKYAG